MATGTRSVWWVVGGAVFLAATYAPTLRAPFDFIDDGNLVYPSGGVTTLRGHAELWWDKVRDNYDHLGPFRPTLWAHWQLAANTLGGDPVAWRAVRLAWCALAAGMLLWLFRELGLRPVAGLVAGAVAMWNPYRNEIWLSLTLSEGVAMPYALFALVAARKAAASDRPLRWELAAAAAALVALGCKNTFAAIVPAQVALRMSPDGLGVREAWRKNGPRALALGVTLLLPAAHFAYFKTHWHPGQYETQPPSAAQLRRIASSLKGAVSLDFMAAGVLLAVAAVWAGRRTSAGPGTPRGAVVCAALLLAGGVTMYLPMGAMSGRYAMPAVWGLDILLAVLLTRVAALPWALPKRAAVVGVGAGLLVVLVACVGRQERVAARSKMLWDVLRHVEATAPPDAGVAWHSGDSLRGGLNVEEGIHLQWHLKHRGRPDIRVGLFAASGEPLARVELPLVVGEPYFRIGGTLPDAPAGWEAERSFAVGYWFGRRRYECHLDRRPAGAGGLHDPTGRLSAAAGIGPK